MISSSWILRPFLELGEEVMPFGGCGEKTSVPLRLVQFDVARNCTWSCQEVI